MPIVDLPRDDRGQIVSREVDVEFSARSGPLQGNNFEADGRHLAPNQPRSLIGALTHGSGSAWRPAPGQTPFGHQHSLQHPGENNNGERTALDGMTVWYLNNRPGDEPVLVLFNHSASQPGTAVPHAYPDDVMLVDGFTFSARDQFFRNFGPIIPRNSDGTWDFTNGLLNSSASASWATYQPTRYTPNMKVLASDRNYVAAIAATDTEPGLEVRQFGLNVPGQDIADSDSIDVTTTTPVGPQIYMRAKNGSHGPTSWTNDPDATWAITNGAEIELDVSRVWGPQADNVRQQTPLFFAIPAATGTFAGDYFEVYGRYDNETGVPNAESVNGSPAAGATIALSGVSTPSDADDTTSTSYLFTKWNTNYHTALKFRRGGPVNDYPTIRFFDNGSGVTITKLLAFRAGLKVNRDDEYTTWHAAYQWERRDGGYHFRGGHSGYTDEFPFPVQVGHNIRMKGFGDPLSQEVPTHMNVALRKFPVDVTRAADEGSQFSAFYNVRYVPIRKTEATTKVISGTTNADPVVVTTTTAHGLVVGDEVQISGTSVVGVDTAAGETRRVSAVGSTTTFSFDVASAPGSSFSGSATLTIPAQWKTNTGYPAHDIRLDKAVVDNYLDEGMIAAGNDPIPGGLGTIGGCYGCSHFGQRMFFWGFAKYPFTSVTFTDQSKIVTSQTDTFRGWMNNRQLVFKGKTYNIRRVIREAYDGTNDAELELVEEYRDGTGSTTSDEAYLAEDNNSLYFTIDDATYGEVAPNTYVIRLPEYGTITSVQPERNGAIIYCAVQAFRLYIDTADGDVYAEAVAIPPSAVEKVNEDNSPAGLHSSVLVEGQLVADNGRGLSAGNTPENMADITSSRNARVFTDLLAVKRSANRVLSYDQTKRNLLMTNCASVGKTYDGEIEYGLAFNMQDGGEMGILYPFLARAAGTTRMQGVARTERTALRDGLIVMFVDVATVGSGGTITTKYNSGSTPDPYIVIYDTLAGTWQAIYVGDDSGVGLAYGIDRHANSGGLTAGTPPITQRHSIQLSDGSMVCLIGKDGGSPFNSRQRLKLTRSSAGTWSVTDYNSGQFSDTYFWSLLPNLSGGFYGLGKDPSGDGNNYMAVWDFGADSVEFPYKKGIGGRHHVLNNTAFNTTNCMKSLAMGPHGEIVVLGYTYTGGTGTIRVRRIDPVKFKQIGTDVTFTLPSGGDPSSSQGPRQFLMNRHGELFITHLNSSGNPALVRYKFVDNGFTAAATTLATGSSNPADKFGIMLDPRNVVWFVQDKTVSSLDGFNVLQFAESDSALTPGGDDFGRADYDRELLSVVQAGAFAYYLVEDTPDGGGTAEYRLIKAIGSTSRTEQAATVYTGDGGPEADETIASTYTDLTTQLVGAGGSLSFVAIDSQVEDGGSCIDQSNGTHLIAMRGSASL